MSDIRKIIPVHEGITSQTFKVPKLRDKYEKHIILTVMDSEDTLKELLEYIRDLARGGHSFTVDVDPGSRDSNKKFYIDGDGTDKIIDISVHEYEE